MIRPLVRSERGARLRLLLQHRGLSQQGLADLYGCSQAFIQQASAEGKFGVKAAHKIAHLLAVPAEWLLAGTNPPEWARVPLSDPTLHLSVLARLKAAEAEMAETAATVARLQQTLKEITTALTDAVPTPPATTTPAQGEVVGGADLGPAHAAQSARDLSA